MTYEVYLAHHGIKGQKWGVRRFQNKDGSYTAAGKKRYGGFNNTGKSRKELNKEKSRLGVKERKASSKSLDEEYNKIIDYGERNNLNLDDGSGGSREAQTKYMKMMDEWEQKHEAALDEANQRAAEKFIEKYGDTTLSKLEKANIRAEIARAIAIFGTIPLALILKGIFDS